MSSLNVQDHSLIGLADAWCLGRNFRNSRTGSVREVHTHEMFPDILTNTVKLITLNISAFSRLQPHLPPPPYRASVRTKLPKQSRPRNSGVSPIPASPNARTMARNNPTSPSYQLTAQLNRRCKSKSSECVEHSARLTHLTRD